ncbi:MAG: DUF2322 family protein [Neisseria sp.]|nr:DUF2322 family protein [Neisseria sp.]
MSFQDNLATLPAIDHLSGLNVLDADGSILHHIPAAPGKLGSLKLYNALAAEFGNTLNPAAAKRGLALFAEHVADAEANPGKHPNIDLLFKVQQQNLSLTLQTIEA